MIINFDSGISILYAVNTGASGESYYNVKSCPPSDSFPCGDGYVSKNFSAILGFINLFNSNFFF